MSKAEIDTIGSRLPSNEVLLNAIKEHTEALQGLSEGLDTYIEANTPDGLVPNSYITEDGRRKAVVWELGLPERMRLIKVKDVLTGEVKWKLLDIGVF